jgi:phosphoglycolate phosphatase-like HAD superfamily hydrolase
MPVLLFDIDGTLVNAGGAGRAAFELAFERVHGVRQAGRDVPFDGKTDFSIYDELCAIYRLRVDPAQRVECLRRYALALDRLMPSAPGARELPGARALVERARAAGHHTGLLTGNIREGARIKLGRFGLDGHFPFGAYGEDGATREKIAKVALARGRDAAGDRALDPASFVVIGDTPRDVACGKAWGMRTLGVATGSHYREPDLAAAGADLVVGTLEGTDALLSWIAAGP